jgi:hypothetical protein
MFDDIKLEQFSTLEELSSATPVWRPFVHHTEHAPVVSREVEWLHEEALQ